MSNTRKFDVNSKTFRLVFSALMLGLATALSMVKLWQMPMGGSVTLGSMAPLVIVSQLYGFGWGSFVCLAYGLLQLLLGVNNFSYATTIAAIVIIAIFDYIGAYWSVALSSLTRGMKSKTLGAALGGVIACLARFAFHFVSGAFVWGEWAEVASLPAFVQTTSLASENILIYSYSFFYNSYMFIEAVITAVITAAVARVMGSRRDAAPEL